MGATEEEADLIWSFWSGHEQWKNVHSYWHQLITTPVFHVGHVTEKKEAHWSLIALADSFLGMAPQESRNWEFFLKSALTRVQTELFSPDYSTGQNWSGKHGTNHCICTGKLWQETEGRETTNSLQYFFLSLSQAREDDFVCFCPLEVLPELASRAVVVTYRKYPNSLTGLALGCPVPLP